MNTHLDAIDLRIVSELQKDGRSTITDLAERVGSSRPTITNRLKRLMDKDIIIVKSGLNLRKFGFKMACVGLEIKSDEMRRKTEQSLKKCPRVLNIFRTPEKANIHIGVWGEDDQTINSTIESFRDLADVEIVYTHYLGTPIYGDLLVNIYPNEGIEAPCSKVCKNCHRYEMDWCIGCPATPEYKAQF